jgi:hypothetical protein
MPSLLSGHPSNNATALLEGWPDKSGGIIRGVTW